MKKIYYFILFLLIIFFSLSFTNAKITLSQELKNYNNSDWNFSMKSKKNLENKIKVVLKNKFKKIIKKISRFDNKKQISIYWKIIVKIDKMIIIKKTNLSSVLILKTLKGLLNEEINRLNNLINSAPTFTPASVWIWSYSFKTSIWLFLPSWVYSSKQDYLLNPVVLDNVVSPLDSSTFRKTIIRRQIAWDFIQPTDENHFNFNHPMVSVIKEYYNLWIEVIPTIQINAKWTLWDSNCNVKKPFPPKDFTENWDSSFWHSKYLYNFIKKFAEEYDGIIHTIVFNNEVEQSNNTWCEPNWDRHKYIKLAATVKKALNDANLKTPIKLADSWMMWNSFEKLALEKAILDRKNIIKNWWTYSKEKEIEILEVLDDRLKVKTNINSLTEVDWLGVEKKIIALANTPAALNAKQIIEWLNGSKINPQLNEPVLDVYNFHSYSSSAWLPLVVNYIKDNYSMWWEIITNEMWITPSNNLLIEDTGTLTEKLVTTTSENSVKIAPSEIVKKYVMNNNLWVSLSMLFTYPVTNKEGIPFLSTFNTDKEYIKENMKAVINLQNRIGWNILSKSFVNDNTNNLQTYTFDFNNKEVKVLWVKNLLNKTNISFNKTVWCSLYDLYWNIKKDNIISEKPVFEECWKEHILN